MTMDRRDFLKKLGLLAAGAALLPKGRSMVGWTRSLESGLYLHKTYGMGFTVSREMLEDSAYWNAHDESGFDLSRFKTDRNAFTLDPVSDYWIVKPGDHPNSLFRVASGFTVKHLNPRDQ